MPSNRQRIPINDLKVDWLYRVDSIRSSFYVAIYKGNGRYWVLTPYDSYFNTPETLDVYDDDDTGSMFGLVIPLYPIRFVKYKSERGIKRILQNEIKKIFK